LRDDQIGLWNSGFMKLGAQSVDVRQGRDNQQLTKAVSYEYPDLLHLFPPFRSLGGAAEVSRPRLIISGSLA
jgi:hypothetical protein